MAINFLSSSAFWKRAKPYAAVIFLRFGFAGMLLLTKHALNQGLNIYSFVVYRHLVATAIITPFALLLERKKRPKMTSGIFLKIVLLALLEPVMDQNLFYLGLKYSSATFVSVFVNILPALMFLLAWVCRLETVNIKSIRTQAKIAGTIVTMGGAMVMTLVRGPIIPMPWINSSNHGAGDGHPASGISATIDHPIKGALMIGGSGICWISFIILQAITAKSYPAELSLTALICLVGAMLGFVLALIMEWGNFSIWLIRFDSKLLAILYTGIICSGVAFYLQAVIMKTEDPVFVTAFSPLSMIIVAILSSFILSETLSLGSLVGALVIITGLYLVLWGKSKDKSATKTLTTQPTLPVNHSPKTMNNVAEETAMAKVNQPMDGSSDSNIIAGRVEEAKENGSVRVIY